MKKLSIWLIVILLVLSAACLTACVKDKARTEYCLDYKGLFSAEQAADINAACAKATKKHNVTVLVATTGRTGSNAELWGEDVLQREGLSGKDDYVLIVINAKAVGKDYHFDIYTYGRAVSRVSADEIDDALWSSYGDSIVTSDSALAAEGAVGLVNMLGRAYDGIPTWLNVVLGILFGLVAGGVVSGLIARSYSRKRKNVTYPLDKYCKMSLQNHEDTYLRSTTTVVVIRSDSGGSGGGGGGSHGGGFSGGGGGGGHRGGR